MKFINIVVIFLLTWIIIFGIKVQVPDETLLSAELAKCSASKLPELELPPSFPMITKEKQEDKNYVIRVLMQHIEDQNVYIETSTANIVNAYNEYRSCVTLSEVSN